MVNFSQQPSGQAFISQYGAVYVKALGTINPPGSSLITAAINTITIICILLWANIVGRRYVY
jgi:SP family sugar:H+ symporter-like MFS transporter